VVPEAFRWTRTGAEISSSFTSTCRVSNADSIDLTAENNVLTVTAERRFEPEQGDQVLIRERPQGEFTRQLLLGENLDVDNVEANYENGVLTLAIPVAEKAKPRRISVGSSGGQQPIEGKSRRT